MYYVCTELRMSFLKAYDLLIVVIWTFLSNLFLQQQQNSLLFIF